MRLNCLAVTAILLAAPAAGQSTPPSSAQDQPQRTKEQAPGTTGQTFDLPVSLDKIKEALEQKPVLVLRTVDERPTFRVEIFERQRIEELLATLNFKAGPTPAGGVYWNEIQRQMFPPVDNPLRQPYSAFGPGELLTILVENLVGKYLGGKAVDAVSNAERAHAESAAKEEVRQAVQQYCAAQPNGGAGIQNLFALSGSPVTLTRICAVLAGVLVAARQRRRSRPTPTSNASARLSTSYRRRSRSTSSSASSASRISASAFRSGATRCRTSSTFRRGCPRSQAGSRPRSMASIS